MDKQSLRPMSAGPETTGQGGSAADSSDGLRATHVIGESSTADTAGPPSSSPQVESEAPPAATRTLSQLGDYLLLKKLGSGAMGAVYKARQVSNQRKVALKVLFKHIADNPKLVERFNREARVSGALDHPNIVQGFEVGEDHGWHFFAMEYVPGD
jgi:serine/threonine protein kinase